MARGRVSISQVAESVPFDNSSNGFVAEDVQAAIEEVATGADYHAGWHNIIASQIVTVVARKQMRISGNLSISGTLILNGILVID